MVFGAAATVPVDLYAVVYGTVGPGGSALGEVADRLLLLNVAAASGVAALHESLRGRAISTASTRTTRPSPSTRSGWACWAGAAH